MSYASLPLHVTSRHSSSASQSPGNSAAAQQFIRGHHNPLAAPSGLRAVSKLQAMSEDELAAMTAAADRPSFSQLAEDLGRLMDHVKLTRHDGVVGGDQALGVGSIVLFPTSHLFAWNQEGLDGNWLICEITAVDEANGSQRIAPQVATLTAWRHAQELSLEDTCFRHQPGETFLMSSWPPNFVQLVNSSALREEHKQQRASGRATEPASGKRKDRSTLPAGACNSLPSSSSQDDEGELNAGGVKVMVDDDGRTHVYSTPAATLMKQELRHVWRTMSLPKQRVLVPGPSLDNSIWSKAILRHIDQVAPPSVHPELAALYEAGSIKNAKVSADPALAERARRMQWVMHDWESLSILHFLTNPRLAATVCIAGNSDKDPCSLFADAITGWREWMSVHFDTAFLQCLTRLEAWLRQAGAGRKNRLDGCRLRFLVENLFFHFHATVTDHSPETRFEGIAFSASRSDTPARLLLALEDEFFQKAAEDPLPHPLHQDWLARNRIIGMTSGTRPAVAAKTRNEGLGGHPEPARAPSQSTTAATAASPAKPAPVAICPWHAGFLLNCADSSGGVKPCQLGANCTKPHVDVRAVRHSALHHACADTLRPGAFRDRVLAAVEAVQPDRPL